ncbi:MAG: TetR/AcrR family transcriptional regulator [Phycisphaerales bacterium]
MSRLPASKRREQLLDCAADLFAKNGYARATTAHLARAAGVTEPIIYRHFDSKRDLFVALIERTGRETIEQWERHLADAIDPAERLRRLVGDNPMVSERGRRAYRVILQAISEVDDPVIHDALRNHLKSLHAFLAEELEAAQKDHKVTQRFSADIMAWLLIHLGLGYGVLEAMAIPGQGTDREGAHVRDIIARLLVGREKADAGA